MNYVIRPCPSLSDVKWNIPRSHLKIFRLVSLLKEPMLETFHLQQHSSLLDCSINRIIIPEKFD